MRSTLLTLLFTLISVISFAGNQLSQIKLSSHNKVDILVKFDGQWYAPTKLLHLHNLMAGNHTVEIHRMEVHYDQMTGVSERFVPAFSGAINLQGGAIVSIVLSNFNDLNVVHTEMIFSQPTVYTPTPMPQNNSCNQANMGYAMDQATFLKLIQLMDEESFDSGKMSIAKNAAMGGQLSSNQVSILISKFSFESNKVEFAKFAYHKVVDPHNYFVTYESFDFSSSKREIQDYIEEGGM